MQRDGAIRRVDGLPALAGFRIERAARSHEGGHIGDRVAHPVTVAVALQVERLVEIHRPSGIDGDVRDIGRVEVGEHRKRGGRLRLGLGIRGVFAGDPEGGGDGGERFGKRNGGRGHHETDQR